MVFSPSWVMMGEEWEAFGSYWVQRDLPVQNPIHLLEKKADPRRARPVCTLRNVPSVMSICVADLLAEAGVDSGAMQRQRERLSLLTSSVTRAKRLTGWDSS